MSILNALTPQTSTNYQAGLVYHGSKVTFDGDVYYIDFKNDRQAFLDAWFDKLLNWDFASKQYAAAKAGQPGWRYPAPQ